MQLGKKKKRLLKTVVHKTAAERSELEEREKKIKTENKKWMAFFNLQSSPLKDVELDNK